MSSYQPPQYPLHRLDTHQAAAYLGFKSSTLKLSRITGTLGGVPAPEFVRMGRRKIVYTREALDRWVNQFQPQTNTAA